MTTSVSQRYRWLLHVDLDQFQVSVERLRSPEFVGVPVIVGGNGDPTEARKVVTCASYEARDVGVRAGMPLRAAYKKLPDAVYLPLDMGAYDAASADVMDVLRGTGHPVEVWGWDEAYLGVGVRGAEVEEFDDAGIVDFAERVRHEILDRCGLMSCVGISDNKQRAKMATGFAKRPPGATPDDGVGAPRVFLLDDRNWLDLMGARPTRDLWSVGPKTSAKLAANGVATVNDLIATPRDDLIATFGPHQGNWLYVLCRGGGDSTITSEPWLARSHSKSRTFATDIAEPSEMRTAAAELLRELLDQVVAEERLPFRVAVTVRTTTFYTRTKSRKLPAPSLDFDQLEAVVADLLTKFDIDRPVRLLGVRLDLVTDEEN
ncbi:DNA polymerase IV [Gordonia alkanivorans CGMCC 6845]|uniref:DNA-directed DNA polymerase n=1 Tax=Gordonia alkanivorans CGMCC 6845 TaxID=1423140 RepID=W9DE92_9ACTN|nr:MULTISPECIES: DNA polymerase IV [Gordonia]ETA04741.1 DNA polymerase IV [Gordonia alkanivorans CGMCC 6845]WJG14435.1 DNA polymerase IV [Gordonia sp. Swx-4]